MKATKLIEKLQELIDDHGDRDVHYHSYGMNPKAEEAYINKESKFDDWSFLICDEQDESI